MTASEQTIIPLSKRKLILLFIGSIAFVLGGISFVINPQKYVGTFCQNPTLIFFGGVGSVLFFGVCAVFIARKLRDKKPGLIIDKQGLTDNSSGIAAGQILWSDIQNITITEIYRQKIILLEVNNPQSYIDREANSYKRKIMQMNMSMYGTPLSITSNALQIKFDELLTLLHDHLDASRK